MTMAVAFMGLSEDEFWRSSPKKIIAMITAWKNVQIALKGGDPEETAGKEKEVKINPFFV